MGYCFMTHETVPGGVKRIALEQIDKTVEQTKPGSKSRDEAIHDARVSLKKLRALLRLARAKHNDDIFLHENTYYRDAGRRLSELRDTTIMLTAFDQLTKHYADQLAADAFAELRKPLLSDDHDLALLCRTVLQQPHEDRTQLEALVGLIDQRRGQLEVEAKRLGKRLYVETSNAFARRFEVY